MTWASGIKKSLAIGIVLSGVLGCSSLPAPKIQRYAFPRSGVFKGEPDRPYKTLGMVRTKVSWPSLLTMPEHEEKELCRNHYNKAVQDLVRIAKKNGGDGVADLKSVVFLYDGRTEYYPTPECSDDGEEGQVLLQGIAFKYAQLTDPEVRIPQENPEGAPPPVPSNRTVPAPTP